MERNIAILMRFFNEVCNQNKPEKIREIFSEHVIFNGKWGSPDEVEKYLREIQNAFKEPKVQINKMLAEEDRVSSMRTWKGIQIKDYHNNQPTNKLMTWTEISVVKLMNGKVVEDWVVHGELEFVE